MADELYFDDFEVGQVFESGPFTISKDYAIAFAKEYDPQYFHVDEEAARSSHFGKLAVSGWQTAAISMKLKAQSGLNKVAGGMVGMGLESMRWPRPVYPGDSLQLRLTITEKRRSQSKPTHGIVRYRIETFNQNDEKVFDALTAIWVPC